MVSYDMKRSLWMIILFFLTGILSAQFLGGDFFSTYGYLSEYQLQGFASCTLDWPNLFGNILWVRGKMLVLFALICTTPAKRMIPVVSRILTGFVMGFFAAACVIQLGGYGILFAIISVFPHALCYLMACVRIYDLHPIYTSDGKRKNWKLFLRVIRVILLYLAGCACETWISTWLLRSLLAWAYR